MKSRPNKGLRLNVGIISDIMPNAGKINTYTSGWPKNQNKCWNNKGSPPPAALKKVVPKCRSVNIIVTVPANTGIIANSKNAVINQLQTKIGIFINDIPGARMFKMVEIILMAAKIEEIPIM